MEKIIAFNFKMNLDYNEIKEYVSNIKGKVKNKSVIFFPPTIFLPYFISNEYSIGAQTISEFDNGAHTGELSCSQLKSIGGTYAIIGHSERRQTQKEDDLLINAKVKKALESGLKVILCIGETKEEYDMLRTSKVLKREITHNLKNIDSSLLENIIIAYEPIWSIGTGVVPSSDEISKTVEFIIDTTFNIYKFKPTVLYGGSVNEKNITELNKIENVSGFLIGGASLDSSKVLKIKEVVEK